MKKYKIVIEPEAFNNLLSIKNYITFKYDKTPFIYLQFSDKETMKNLTPF